jgi:L-2-hydroxyglutarate oxidase LhgO
MVGIDIEKQGYPPKYCKGQYSLMANLKKCALVKRLFYPVLHERIAVFGVHVNKDLSGGLRLGPDAC